MALIVLRGRFGRIIPLWMKCLAFGLGASWVVALGHWALVESGTLPRDVFNIIDNDAAGVTLLEHAYRAANGLPPRGNNDEKYYVMAYGWPVRNWGTIFREDFSFPWQLGVRPVWALDLRAIWATSNRTVDPRNPAFSPASPPPPYPSGVPRLLMFADPYERYLPIFPLIGHSVLASAIYGAPLFVWLKVRDARRRRGHCERCGYDCSGTPRSHPCPECGTPDHHRTLRRKP